MLHNVTIYSIHGSYGFCFLLRASFRGRVKLCQAGGALSHREIYAARRQRVVGMQRDSFITMVTNPHELGYNYGYLSTYTIHIYISGTAFPSSKIRMIPAMIPAVLYIAVREMLQKEHLCFVMFGFWLEALLMIFCWRLPAIRLRADVAATNGTMSTGSPTGIRKSRAGCATCYE